MSDNAKALVETAIQTGADRVTAPEKALQRQRESETRMDFRLQGGDNGVEYPCVTEIVRALLEVWPEHERIARRSLEERDPDLMAHTEEVADIVIRVSANQRGGLLGVIDDYRYMCERLMMPEEWYFRRNNRYRLSTFEQANAEVYANTEVMNRYMRGVLASHVLWLNHSAAINHYRHEFLPSVVNEADLLEVGPGHGLLLFLASRQARVGKISGWDVSPSSLAMTRASLAAMNMQRAYHLSQRNLFDHTLPTAADDQYDAIVLSEVLEHVEKPIDALRTLHRLTRPGGSVWINVPVNSPAPDHIYLLRHPDEAADLVSQAGFDVATTAAFPTAGATLERAIRHELSINCVVVGTKSR